ncbi:MAG: DUF3078 domain-containing protein [Bacteroidota bacterium]|nr:DUF3078 domain-containing protein [Bacteroidota bacterium]
MKQFLFIFIVLLTSVVYSQNIADSLLNKWIPKGVSGINISQVSFNNWAQGGDNSILWVLNGEFGLSYYTKAHSLLNNLKLAYGRPKLGGESYRTNDNEFYMENVFSYFVGWVVEPYISNIIRSPISTGYDYKVTPAVKTADFFDPGYVSQSIGFSYSRNKVITTRLGAAFQETFTNKYRQYTDDPSTLDKIEAFKFETGIESVTDLKADLGGNMLIMSELRLFTRFNHMDVWDVRWDNTIVAQVNNYINVKLNFLTLYEKSLSAKTQFKEALLLGFTYTFF